MKPMKPHRNAQATRPEVEASEWIARLADPAAADDADRQREFATWLRQSKQNVHAFLAASDAFYRLDGLRSALTPETRRMLEEHSSSVAHIPGRRPLENTSHQTWRIAGVAAALATIALGTTLYFQGSRPELEFVTAPGEQRTVKLPDGSLVRLNTRSRLNVRYSSDLRQAVLLEGEALFTVERDLKRPFQVDAGGARVRVLGTAFNVYRRPERVEIAVVEGRVEVFATPTQGSVKASGVQTPRRLTLDAGEEAHVSESDVAKVAAPGVPDAVAWQQRRLVFRNTPLADVATEFNRYNQGQLRIEGKELQARPLTGIFSADHPQSLILYLSEFRSLKVEPAGKDWIVSAR